MSFTSRVICTVSICFVGIFLVPTASAVVSKKTMSEPRSTEWITTGVAARARSDVQVRRLMEMFAAREIDSEYLYEKLQTLRQVK